MSLLHALLHPLATRKATRALAADYDATHLTDPAKRGQRPDFGVLVLQGWPADAFTRLTRLVEHAYAHDTGGPWTAAQNNPVHRQRLLIDCVEHHSHHGQRWSTIAPIAWLLVADTNHTRAEDLWLSLFPQPHRVTAFLREHPHGTPARSVLAYAAGLTTPEAAAAAHRAPTDDLHVLAALRGYRFGPNPLTTPAERPA